MMGFFLRQAGCSYMTPVTPVGACELHGHFLSAPVFAKTKNSEKTIQRAMPALRRSKRITSKYFIAMEAEDA
jgi:hypothetical protein